MRDCGLGFVNFGKNIVIEGLSGSLGDQLVIQAGKRGTTIILTKPQPGDKPPSEAQQAARASASRRQWLTPRARRRRRLTSRRRRVRRCRPITLRQPFDFADAPLRGALRAGVAAADWLHPPEVVEIDLEAWTGGPGEKLRAKVRDDVKVEKVTFVIAQADMTLVEQGAATQAEGLWWEYVTTVDHPGGAAKVLVLAQDLPGHEASLEAEKSVT